MTKAEVVARAAALVTAVETDADTLVAWGNTLEAALNSTTLTADQKVDQVEASYDILDAMIDRWIGHSQEMAAAIGSAT
jgi:hypothetical protein